jgi:uncharacterized membrane protein
MGNVQILLNTWKVQLRWTLRGWACIMAAEYGRGATYGATAGDGMGPFWEADLERLVIGLAILAVLVVVAWYVVGKIRPKTVQKERSASQWLSKCRDLHTQGELSDEEFRTIKTTLATQLQDELNGNGEKG